MSVGVDTFDLGPLVGGYFARHNAPVTGYIGFVPQWVMHRSIVTRADGTEALEASSTFGILSMVGAQLRIGPGGLFGSKAEKQIDTGTGVAVNAYLWRASLDTINFIPLVSADPFGGVIITDWYTPAETPNERMKVQVTILDRDLRADGVRVAVFKQTTSPRGGNWVDAAVDPRTNIDIENAILTRARQLRLSNIRG